jgi:hypothetical protein
MGNEDETIIQKIRVYKTSLEILNIKNSKKISNKKSSKTQDKRIARTKKSRIWAYETDREYLPETETETETETENSTETETETENSTGTERETETETETETERERETENSTETETETETENSTETENEYETDGADFYNDGRQANDYISEFWVYDSLLTEKLRINTHERVFFGQTFARMKRKIEKYKFKNKNEYLKECDKNIQLIRDPENYFKDTFTNWVDYLSIPPDLYYNFNECQDKIKDYLEIKPEIKNYRLDLSQACIELCRLDDKFPDNEFWLDFYKVSDLSKIISIPKDRRKKF